MSDETFAGSPSWLSSVTAAPSSSEAQEPTSSSSETQEPTERVYGDLESWLTDEFIPMYRREVAGDFRWCARWWEHPEAVLRLEALWRSWEKLRLDPDFGMAVWYRDYVDVSLLVLTGVRGPFERCSPTRHVLVDRLPLEPRRGVV